MRMGMLFSNKILSRADSTALEPAARRPSTSESEVLLRSFPWSVPECTRLTTEYERLKRAYGAAVDRLFATGYQATDAEYRKLRTFVEDARIDLEVARLELERHMRTHAGTDTHLT
jgi:predicted GNAT superfamily acetyltransferase